MTIDEAREHIGATVLYHPQGTSPEEGVIRHVTRFVFVAYSGDVNGARATSPEDITLIEAATAAGEGNQ